MGSCEPIKNGAEGDEGGERSGEFVVPCRDTAVPFQRAEEIFHVMAMAVIAAMKGPAFLTSRVERQTRKDILFDQQRAQGIGIIAFVRDQRAAVALAQIGHQGRRHADISDVPGAQQQLQGAAVSIDQRMNLGCQPASAQADGLGFPAALGIESAVVEANITGVDEAQPPARFLRQPAQNAIPETKITPSGKMTVGGSPVKVGGRQIAPRATRAQHVQQRFHHLLQLAFRPSGTFPFLPVFTRLWLLYVGRASAPIRGVYDRSSARILAKSLIRCQAFSNTP